MWGFPVSYLLLLVFVYWNFVSYCVSQPVSLWFYPLWDSQTLCASWTWVTISFPMLGRFLTNFFKVFSSYFFCFSLFWDPYNSSVGKFNLLCLRSPFCSLSSSCCWCLPLVGEFGPIFCVGFLVGGPGACALVDCARSCPSDGQGHVRWYILGVSLGLVQL